MRRLASLVFVVAVPGVAASGVAVTDADLGDPGPVELRGTLSGTEATFEVRYLIPIAGPGWSPELAELALPDGAVVTSATVVVGSGSHALALVPADDASNAFTTITTVEPAASRRWAVALSASFGRIDVAAAVPRATTLDLRLEVNAPTCFERDTRYVAIPPTWKARVPATAPPTSCGEGEAWTSFASKEVGRQPSGERVRVVADGLDVRDHEIGRVELDVAGALGDVPKDLDTVLVVDHSRSLDYSEQETIRGVIDAYLAAAPDSRVQVVAFARTATPLLADWTLARTAKPAIARALEAAPLRNGTNLDVALAEATSWLARVPGTHRVVVLTDARLAQRLRDHEDALRAGDALIHVVDVDATSTLHRDDDAPLARVALATGGIATVAGTTDTYDATMLARPISFDHVSVSAPEWAKIPSLRSTCRGDLAEGRSCTWWGRSNAKLPITVSGYVWGKLVSRVVQPDATAGRDVARELAVSSSFDTDPDADAVAHDAFAVDRAWSLLATWGGDGGYADTIGLIGERSGTGCGGCGDWGSTPLHGYGSRGWIIKESVEAQLAHAVAGCNFGAARVELAIELTRHEIVDVDATIVPPGRDPSITSGPVHACVVDAVWNANLVIPQPPEHQTRRIVIVGA